MNQTEVDFAEQYMEKRAIQSGNSVQATVNNISCETKSRVILTVDIYNHLYNIKIDRTDNLDSKIFKNLLRDLDGFDNGSSLSIKINEEGTKCSFTDSNEKYDISSLEVSNSVDTAEYYRKGPIEKLLLWYEYNNARSELKVPVTSVKEINNDKFELQTVINSVKLSWELQVPNNLNKNQNSVTKLIEEQGGGNPLYLPDGGYVNIVHRMDVDNNLDKIGYDKTGNWALVVPSDYDNWTRVENRNRSNNRTNLGYDDLKNSLGSYSTALFAIGGFIGLHQLNSAIITLIGLNFYQEALVTANNMVAIMGVFLIGINMIVRSQKGEI